MVFGVRLWVVTRIKRVNSTVEMARFAVEKFQGLAFAFENAYVFEAFDGVERLVHARDSECHFSGRANGGQRTSCAICVQRDKAGDHVAYPRKIRFEVGYIRQINQIIL